MLEDGGAFDSIGLESPGDGAFLFSEVRKRENPIELRNRFDSTEIAMFVAIRPSDDPLCCSEVERDVLRACEAIIVAIVGKTKKPIRPARDIRHTLIVPATRAATAMATETTRS